MPEPTVNGSYYSVRDAASELGVTAARVRQFLAEPGIFNPSKLKQIDGRTWLIASDEIARLKAERKIRRHS